MSAMLVAVLPPELRTARVVLRQWRRYDREPFAAMNADGEVMEHFPAVLSRAESDDLAGRAEVGLGERGWGLWAAEIAEGGSFAGFVGLNPAPDGFPCGPRVEIDWRLSRRFWGRGLATEAARAVLGFAFDTVGVAEIVSFTAATNLRSQRVMQKLGLGHDPADDFDHPGLPEGHRLRRCVLYRIRRDA